MRLPVLPGHSVVNLQPGISLITTTVVVPITLSEQERQQNQHAGHHCLRYCGRALSATVRRLPVRGALAGKNAVENNYLSVSEKTELS